MRMAKRARVCSVSPHEYDGYFTMPVTSASLEPIPYKTTGPVCHENAHDVYTAITPHENDILLGRGGKNNQHVGNEQLRVLARMQKEKYRHASKLEKSSISRKLVAHVRNMSPPGRFLKKNSLTAQWEDVGDTVAREKVSQVFRDTISAGTGSPAHTNEEEHKVDAYLPLSPSVSKIPEGYLDFLPPKKSISRKNDERAVPRLLVGGNDCQAHPDNYSFLKNSPVRVNKNRRAMEPPMSPSVSEHPYHYAKPVTPERNHKNIFRPISLPYEPNFSDIVESDLLGCLNDNDINEFDLFSGDLLGAL